MKNFVSIVVPIYNAACYLEDCVNSIVNQTYKSLEILLINDGSLDDSLIICKAWERMDARIRVIDKPNTGVSDTRNAGILAAKGKFIAFVDADDYVELDYIEKLVKEFDDTCNGVLGYHAYDYAGRVLKRNARVREGIYLYEELQDYLIDDGTLTGILFGSVCGGLYLTDIISKNNLLFEKDIKKNEDGVFNVKYIYMAGCVKVIECFGYIYRQWKDKVKLNEGCFDTATLEIKRFYESTQKEYIKSNAYQKQMQSRSICVLFWEILNRTLCEKIAYDTYKYIKKKMKSIDKHYYTSINKVKIRREKYWICLLMKHRMALCFMLGIKFVYVPLKKRMRR